MYATGGENRAHLACSKTACCGWRFVSTTEAESGGVPAEAWQRLLYDTAAFTSVEA